LLSTKNFRKGAASKLLPRWVGPFPICEQINSQASRLDLPATYKVHDVFHTSLLKPFRDGGAVQPPQPGPDLSDETPANFAIDYKVLDTRELTVRKTTRRGRPTGKPVTQDEYLVRWGGRTESVTWEPAANIPPPELIAQFLAARGEDARSYGGARCCSVPAQLRHLGSP
jgi:hypothetical protein